MKVNSDKNSELFSGARSADRIGLLPDGNATGMVDQQQHRLNGKETITIPIDLTGLTSIHQTRTEVVDSKLYFGSG